MIRVNALTRAYGAVVAVDNVSFEIRPREIVGLLGHNGAGKTTIMKMMTGYLEPSSGNISINGIDVWSERCMIQRQIGYLPENCPLYPEMTALDYLDYAAALRGVSKESSLDRLGYVIQKTNLVGVVEQPIGTLSRGYRQRLGVAQAILNTPSILILDEPTNGLDPSQIVEMRSLIKELAETATVVVSTHILQEVQAVCGRVIVINNGKVALDAALADLQQASKLRISTDADLERCSHIIEKVPGLHIAHCEKIEDQYHYTVVPAPDITIQKVAAVLARLLVEEGSNVYALYPVKQNLESIFAEITTGNAAAAKMENLYGVDGVRQLADSTAVDTFLDANEHRKEVTTAQQDGTLNG